MTLRRLCGMTTNTGRLASIELATTIARFRLAERQATQYTNNITKVIRMCEAMAHLATR